MFLLNKVVNYFDSIKIHFHNFFLNIFLFIRYLKEIGYVDTIIDIRSTAVKKLLGIKSETNLNGDMKTTNESKR
jgi:hypothetical protein